MNNSQSELPHRKRFRDENPTTLSSPEQSTNKKRKKKNKNKSKNKGQGALVPHEQNEQLHACPNPNQVTPEVAIEKKEGEKPSECSPKPPPEDTPRKRKNQNVLNANPNSNGAELIESNIPEPPQVCSGPKSASTIHSQQETPTDPQHIGEPTEIPASHKDQKPSIDSASPILPKQKMSKRQRRKRYQIALKIKRAESEKHHTESTAEIPVQRPHGLEAASVPFKSNDETSVSKGNVEQPANIQVQRSKRLTTIPFEQHGQSSMRCLSCHQPGHKMKNCRRLRRPSYNDEICFFCGEIGHSLAKCSVSRAGGRFARCLFCYAHGHFTNKCPRNGHGIDPKVVAANGPVDKALEA